VWGGGSQDTSIASIAASIESLQSTMERQTEMQEKQAKMIEKLTEENKRLRTEQERLGNENAKTAKEIRKGQKTSENTLMKQTERIVKELKESQAKDIQRIEERQLQAQAAAKKMESVTANQVDMIYKMLMEDRKMVRSPVRKKAHIGEKESSRVFDDDDPKEDDNDDITVNHSNVTGEETEQERKERERKETEEEFGDIYGVSPPRIVRTNAHENRGMDIEKKDMGLWGDEEDSDDEQETMEQTTIQEAPSREHAGGPQDK
jgi:hypothetical protein